MDPGSSRLHVVRSLSGGWVVRASADGPAIRRTSTRRGALAVATNLLFHGRGGQVQLHEEDGTVVETHEVVGRGRRPWWYSPPRVVTLVVGSSFVIEGVVDVWSSSHLMFWLGWVLVVTGAAQVVSHLVSRRADRALQTVRLPPTSRGTDAR